MSRVCQLGNYQIVAFKMYNAMGQCSSVVERSPLQGERQPFDSVRCHQQRSLNDKIPWSIPGDAGAIPAVAIFFALTIKR
jgi:hypothetical protein